MTAGWNLLSSDIAFSVTEKLSDSSKFVSVWKWEDNTWAVYLPGLDTAAYAGSKGFNELTGIKAGEGFWVNCKAQETVTVSGVQETGSLSLTKGWNLVGLKTGTLKSVADLISGNEDSIFSLWKWENNTWAVYLPGEADGGAAYAAGKGFALLTEIEPGEGFWVNASGAVILN